MEKDFSRPNRVCLFLCEVESSSIRLDQIRKKGETQHFEPCQYLVFIQLKILLSYK